MARKKAGRTKASSKKSASRKAAPKKGWTGKGKFHGVIHVVPPAGGQSIGNGTQILVALRKLFFGNVPDPGKNQLSVAMVVETDKESGGVASGDLKFDLIKYAKDHQALNFTDLVLFSGKVHRYLTIRCNIDELDEDSVEATQILISEGFGVAQDLMVGGGPGAASLGGVPGFFGALMAFNRDDQVLMMNRSFYTDEVNAPGKDRTLREGVYLFRKLPIGAPVSGPAQVELELEVIPVN